MKKKLTNKKKQNAIFNAKVYTCSRYRGQQLAQQISATNPELVQQMQATMGSGGAVEGANQEGGEGNAQQPPSKALQLMNI